MNRYAQACYAEAEKHSEATDVHTILLQAATEIEHLEKQLDRAQRPTAADMAKTVDV